MRSGLTYDDVALVPKFNNISSRKDPTIDLSTSLTRNTRMGIPILAANMESVIGTDLARILVKAGSVPIFHRFCSSEQRLEWLKEFPNAFFSMGVQFSAHCGTFIDLHRDHGLKGVVIDVAHGHSDKMLATIETLKGLCPNLEVIAGNVCTPEAVHDLFRSGADGIKIGVGPGAACTTRRVTGFGVPQMTAIMECAKEASKYEIPIIADGGIRGSNDIVLGLGGGASSVMVGKLFALTDESAAEKRWERAEFQAKYRGQASKEFQDSWYGEDREVAPEGEAFWGPVSGSASDLLKNLLNGIRTGMTYGGARNIKELQKKAEFIRVTPSYLQESAVRK